MLTRLLVTLSLVLAATPAAATCWRECSLRLLDASCAEQATFAPGAPLTFTYGCGTCCAAGGRPGGCNLHPAQVPACLRLVRLGHDRNPVSWPGEPLAHRATGRACGGMPVHEIDGPVPEGRYVIGSRGGGEFAVAGPPKAPLAEAQLDSVPAVGLAAARDAGTTAVAALVGPQSRPTHVVVHLIGPDAKRRGQVFRAALPPRQLISEVALAPAPGGWIVAAGTSLFALDQAGAPRGPGRPLASATSYLVARPGRGPLLVYGTGGAAHAVGLDSHGREERPPQVVGPSNPGGVVPLGDGFVAACPHGDGTVLALLDGDGRLVGRRFLPVFGSVVYLARSGADAVLEVGGVRFVIGPNGAPTRPPIPGSNLPLSRRELEGGEVLAAYGEAGQLVLERLGAGARRSRTRFGASGRQARVALVPDHLASAPIGASVLVVVSRLDARPGLFLARVAVPPPPGASSKLRPGVCPAAPAAAPPGDLCPQLRGPGVAACRAHATVPAHQVALAARPDRLALAWVDGASGGARAPVRFGLIGDDLALTTKRTVLEAEVLGLELVAHGPGWLLAVVTWDGITLRALGPDGAPRGQPRRVPGGAHPRFVPLAHGRLLLAWAEGPTAILAAPIRPDGGLAAGPARFPLKGQWRPPTLVGTAVGDDALLAWEDAGHATVARVGADGLPRAGSSQVVSGTASSTALLVRALQASAGGARLLFTSARMALGALPLRGDGRAAGPPVALVATEELDGVVAQGSLRARVPGAWPASARGHELLSPMGVLRLDAALPAGRRLPLDGVVGRLALGGAPPVAALTMNGHLTLVRLGD